MEIKFRAWYKKYKKIAYNDEDIFEDVDYWDGCKSSRIGMLNSSFTELLTLGDIIYMQFVGLTDKSGTEIYDSDLMKSDKGVIFKVIWSKRRSGWAVITRNIYRDERNDKEFNYKSIEWAVNNCFVIGNIHENPELLS